jgi:tetratricopeptide (TPR) repeat protein
MKTIKVVQITSIFIILLSLTTASSAQQKQKNNATSASITSDYQPKILNFDLKSDVDKKRLSDLLKTCWILLDGRTVSYKNIDVNSDSTSIILDRDTKTIISYADLDYCLSVSKQQWEQHFKGIKYFIQFGDNCTLNYDHNNYTKAEELCDILYTLQHQVNVKNALLILTDFKQLAEQYRNAIPKPEVSEEQRKYIVQANLFSQEKDYKKAITAYNKFVEVNPTAYPAAYYNLSLLYSQVNFFDKAILNMKKYLLLVPDASDARAAQDKIYEWETNFAN